MPLKKHAPKSRKLKKAAAPGPITNYFELVKEGESAPFYINASREDIVAKANVVAKTGKTVNVFFVGRRLIGFCTETCANNADCGSGFACVNAACNGVTCSPICVPSCTTDTDCRRGTCRDITNASTGGSSSVCDIRRANGTTCTWDGDCQSANCNQFGNCE